MTRLPDPHSKSVCLGQALVKARAGIPGLPELDLATLRLLHPHLNRAQLDSKGPPGRPGLLQHVVDSGYYQYCNAVAIIEETARFIV